MSHTLRVTNLPQTLDCSGLEEMFTIVGNVRSTQILLNDVAGISRRFALVEMSTADEVQDCLRYFNGQVNDSHALIVRQDKPHVPLPPVFAKENPAARTRTKRTRR